MQPELNTGDGQWYAITDIKAHKKRKGRMYYLVNWTDGSQQWVPRCDVTDHAVDLYHVNRRASVRRRRKRS